MQKHHVHTTISSKHQELLKKQVEKYGSQQKVIEFALENLENTFQQSPKLSPEEKLLLHSWRENLAYVVEKEVLTWLLKTADIEQFELLSQKKSLVFTLEYYYQRPLKQVSLKEILDGLVIMANISNMFDTYNYSEDDGHYMLKMHHNIGLNASKYFKTVTENVFDAYGAEYESIISDRSVFIKIYKNAS